MPAVCEGGDTLFAKLAQPGEGDECRLGARAGGAARTGGPPSLDLHRAGREESAM